LRAREFSGRARVLIRSFSARGVQLDLLQYLSHSNDLELESSEGTRVSKKRSRGPLLSESGKGEKVLFLSFRRVLNAVLLPGTLERC